MEWGGGGCTYVHTNVRTDRFPRVLQDFVPFRAAAQKKKKKKKGIKRTSVRCILNATSYYRNTVINTHGNSGVLTIDVKRKIACADFMVPDLTFAATEFDPNISLFSTSIVIFATHWIFVDPGRRAKKNAERWKDAGKGE